MALIGRDTGKNQDACRGQGNILESDLDVGLVEGISVLHLVFKNETTSVSTPLAAQHDYQGITWLRSFGGVQDSEKEMCFKFLQRNLGHGDGRPRCFRVELLVLISNGVLPG
jgi:hypothetical protein